MYQLDSKNWAFNAHPLRYNPYLQLPYPEKPLDKEAVTKHINDNRIRTKNQLSGGERTISVTPLHAYELTYATITITTEQQSLQDLPHAFDAELIKEI